MKAGVDELRLPNWEIPPAPPATVTHDEYLRWLGAMREELRRNGLLEQLRNDPTRQPVDEPFVL